jgi:hypothetical protein
MIREWLHERAVAAEWRRYRRAQAAAELGGRELEWLTAEVIAGRIGITLKAGADPAAISGEVAGGTRSAPALSVELSAPKSKGVKHGKD